METDKMRNEILLDEKAKRKENAVNYRLNKIEQRIEGIETVYKNLAWCPRCEKIVDVQNHVCFK